MSAESGLGQAYIASAICENSKAKMRPPAIRRPHCVTMRRMEAMVGCSLRWMCDELTWIKIQSRGGSVKGSTRDYLIAVHERSPRAQLRFSRIQLVGAPRTRPV